MKTGTFCVHSSVRRVVGDSLLWCVGADSRWVRVRIYVLLDAVLAANVNKYFLATATCQQRWQTNWIQQDLCLGVEQRIVRCLVLNQSQQSSTSWFGQSANHGIYRPWLSLAMAIGDPVGAFLCDRCVVLLVWSEAESVWRQLLLWWWLHCGRQTCIQHLLWYIHSVSSDSTLQA